MEPINLRSDTETLPTPAMLEAMASAKLGDDTYDECPTVHRFEEMAAAAVGKPAAMLLISGHMANLVAMMCHCAPGDAVVLDAESHIHHYEVGSVASVAGLMPHAISSHAGAIPLDELRAVATRPDDIHYPRTRLMCLENTHNRSGGRAVPLATHAAMCDVARENGLKIHLDGARIFNAAAATDSPVADYAGHVDSIMFALSKGLSCPLGSVLAGERDFIERADHVRRRLGGGMRQAGILAAAGIVALETMVDRLVDDHTLARRLAEKLDAIDGLSVDLDTVESNMVYVRHTQLYPSTTDAIAWLREAGVIASPRPPNHVRFVTNRHHTTAMIDEAVARVRRAVDLLGPR